MSERIGQRPIKTFETKVISKIKPSVYKASELQGYLTPVEFLYAVLTLGYTEIYQGTLEHAIKNKREGICNPMWYFFKNYIPRRSYNDTSKK